MVRLRFTPVGKLPPPVLQFTQVAFGYSPNKILYSNVDLGVDLDSRVAIVGPNGEGAGCVGFGGPGVAEAGAMRCMTHVLRYLGLGA